jgi:hypothetical protein
MIRRASDCATGDGTHGEASGGMLACTAAGGDGGLARLRTISEATVVEGRSQREGTRRRARTRRPHAHRNPCRIHPGALPSFPTHGQLQASPLRPPKLSPPPVTSRRARRETPAPHPRRGVFDARGGGGHAAHVAELFLIQVWVRGVLGRRTHSSALALHEITGGAGRGTPAEVAGIAKGTAVCPYMEPVVSGIKSRSRAGRH